MEDNKYNGWNNYATWCVQLEIVSDYISNMASDDEDRTMLLDMSFTDLCEHLSGYVDEVVCGYDEQIAGTLAESYAQAFLSEVDWAELAHHAQEDLKAYKPYEEAKS